MSVHVHVHVHVWTYAPDTFTVALLPCLHEVLICPGIHLQINATAHRFAFILIHLIAYSEIHREFIHFLENPFGNSMD